MIQILTNQPLGACNTLALDADAAAVATIASEAELRQALTWAAEHSLPVVPLGEGSNVVLAGKLDALVLRMQNRGVEVLQLDDGAVTLRVAAGENWHQLVKWSVEQGYCGLQNLALIPGTVGAAPIQNIGAYGVELESVLRRVHAVRLADGESLSLARDECELGYRDSIFKHGLRDSVVITAVDIELSLAHTVDISYPALAAIFDGFNGEPGPEDVFAAVVDIRSRKLPDPAIVPNAGSFFKNPVLATAQASALTARFPALPVYPQHDGSVKVPAAWMIEHCGWKGVERDGVGVHQEHALVLVNKGANNGAVLLQLAQDICTSVEETFGIQLAIEPRVYR